MLINNNDRDNDSSEEPLEKFNIISIFLVYLIIDLLSGNRLIVQILFTLYFFHEIKRLNLNYERIIGRLRKINFKLIISLVITDYLFNWGANSIILYSLSFIFPKYVQNQINQEYANNLITWVLFSITALIFAPLMEELFFRGIVFQKIAIKKGFLTGLLTSAILFAAIHFRFDFIPLFIMGIVLVLLYLKSKQLHTVIIFHFLYNFLVIVEKLYYQLFYSSHSTRTTIAEYQQHFSDRLEIYILLIAVSLPYLCYFIYKNYPRNYDVRQLPYFANQTIADDR